MTRFICSPILILSTAVVVLCACPAIDDDAGVVDSGDGDVLDDAGTVDGGAVDGGADGGSLFEPFPVVDPLCDVDGCLRAVSPGGTVPKELLEQYLSPGVVVENGYEVFLVRYFTAGREARVTVTIPWPMAAPEGGFHIVVNNPGTVGIGDVCALGNNVGGPGLAGAFGAYGLIGAAVDYPGLGTDGSHPYLVADVEGKASLDAAKATIALARYQLVGISRRIAIVGLSQGGHATLAAAARHSTYQSNLDIRAFAVSAPGSVSLPDWALGVVIPGPHMLYHALIVYAYAEHYGHDGAPLFVAPFSDVVDTVMETACTFSESGPLLDDEIPDDATLVFDSTFLEAFSSADLSSYPAIAQGFEENRIDAYAQTAPLLIYQGAADTTVPESMTAALVARLRDGGVEVDYRVVDGAEHTDVAFGFVAYPQLRGDEARAWLLAHLNAP